MTTNMQKHLLDAIETIGFENEPYFTSEKTEAALSRFSYERFLSEKGWQIEKDGLSKSVNDWLSGLAINIAYNNHEIISLGKEWGEINETASEAREWAYIDHWFNNLSDSLIQLWQKHNVIKG